MKKPCGPEVRAGRASVLKDRHVLGPVELFYPAYLVTF